MASSLKRKQPTAGPPDPAAAPRKRHKADLLTPREWEHYEKSLTRSGETARSASAAKPPTTKKKKSNKKKKNNRKETRAALDQTSEADLEGLLFIKHDTLSKSKEPCSVMRNETPLVAELPPEQRARALVLLPPRSAQTMESLAPRSSVFSDIDFCQEMKRVNMARPGQNVYPLQRLMNDFVPIDKNPEPVVLCMGKELQLESDYITHTNKAAAAAASAQETPAKKQDLSITKLNLIFGTTYHSYGYNRRTPKEVEERMDQARLSERLQMFRAFYARDRIETEVNFGEIPSNFRMFRELKQNFYRRYQLSDQIVKDSASLTPKVEMEAVPRLYIQKFRAKPKTGDELCANGENCLFNTFSQDKHVSYIGRVFYTPRELRRGVPVPPPTAGNRHRLCIDCLLKLWTITHAQNISNEVLPERQINYFGVQCKAGEYSKHCLLSVVENDKPTGIVGHVPRFSLNNRQMMVVVRTVKEGQRLHKIYVPFLAEIGTDF